MMNEVDPIIRGDFKEVAEPASACDNAVWHHSMFDFDVEEGVIANNGKSSRLTLTEKQILVRLFRACPTVVSHFDMVKDVMGYINPGSSPSNLYRGFVANIRKGLGNIGVDGESVIVSVIGTGYRLRDALSEGLSEGVTEEKVTERVFSHSDFEFYPDRLVVKRSDSTEMRLTPIENRILEELFLNRNQVVTREQFLKVMWSGGEELSYYEPGLVKAHIHNIRSKIELKSRKGKGVLVTQHGVGYKLVDRDE